MLADWGGEILDLPRAIWAALGAILLIALSASILVRRIQARDRLTVEARCAILESRLHSLETSRERELLVRMRSHSEGSTETPRAARSF